MNSSDEDHGDNVIGRLDAGNHIDSAAALTFSCPFFSDHDMNDYRGGK